MRELNDAIVSSRKIKFEEFKEEDHKTTSVSSSEEPMENGAKQLVIRFRKVVQAPKRKQSTYWLDTIVNCNRKNCLNEMLLPWWFRKRYYFLFENNLPAGKEELKKQLKKSIDPNAIENMKKWISWIGGVPTACNLKYPIAEIRRRSLMEKYNKLKLESFIEKRRSNNAAEDHICMPYRRPINNDQ
ncbi:hypothetical protein WN943_009913 [Citrus x changshan-huyou]